MGFLIGILAVPVIEIIVAVLVAGAIGWWPTLLALLALSALGEIVLRRTGRRTSQQLSEAMRTGRGPDAEITNAGITMLGGLLLLLPGFVTGAIGLLLIVPVTHPLVRRLAGRRLGRHVRVVTWLGRSRAGSGDVIEGEVVDGQPTRSDEAGPRSLGG